MIERLKRRVYCDWLDLHVGHVKTAKVDTERYELALTFLPCTRCGRLKPLVLRPWHELEAALLDEPIDFEDLDFDVDDVGHVHFDADADVDANGSTDSGEATGGDSCE